MNQVVHIERTSSARREQVFALLAEIEGWPSWSRFDEGWLEREGDRDRQGVGAIRRFRKGRSRSREEVVAFEHPARFAYTLLSGLPIRNYRADVTLTDTPAGGTTITWHSTFRAKVRGTGWIYRLALRRFIGDLAGDLATAAAARVAT